ncbi:MAG TPA: hypothetical protein PKV16_00895 [Caldisericia bacterium]|nr:hypothetical protein [Caldisericia bacterium]HPF49031.1 hypothetical protein [Caldisericia bacterium]HPI83105.1 hypothetical protein [Caldisericia bacterium]HPQ92332.1 hypothetical protein [Caldisericia bacterium]HRV74570.1 hypothetical protein [Caldisericia bacterium]
MSSAILDLLRETAQKIKHCQELTVSSPDGLTIESFPGEDKSLTDALSASSSSILGIASAISERAGKLESEYVLVKNPDSYLLVFAAGTFSLFVIAGIKANLGMLLYRAGLLKSKLQEILGIDSEEELSESNVDEPSTISGRMGFSTENEVTGYDDIAMPVSEEEIRIEPVAPPDETGEHHDSADTTQSPDTTQPSEGFVDLTGYEFSQQEESESENTMGAYGEPEVIEGATEDITESDDVETPTISFSEEDKDLESFDTTHDFEIESEAGEDDDNPVQDEAMGYDVGEPIKRGYDDIVEFETDQTDEGTTKQVIEPDDKPTEMISYLQWRDQQDKKNEEIEDNDEEDKDLFEGF